jgi:hypothetical protein
MDHLFEGLVDLARVVVREGEPGPGDQRSVEVNRDQDVCAQRELPAPE